VTIILAIEDEPSILENVLETLELGGFKALGAPDGLAGLELARQHLPDLIISDVMMPGMDGYDVLLALRSEAATASIPFIFLTARAERAAVRQAMEFGADDYLVKPFTTSELLVAVTSRLTRHAGIAQEQQDKLKDLRGNLLHMLPHELRTPLNAVLGYAELLVADAANMDPGEIVDMAGRIQKGGLRLLCLVENFLLMAQIEIVKSDPEWLARLREGSTPRPEVVIRAVAEKKAKQANREGDLVLDLADAGAVQASEDNLRKLVEELLDNAF
jgi:two-component system sensor histidine kinase/response regulator